MPRPIGASLDEISPSPYTMVTAAVIIFALGLLSVVHLLLQQKKVSTCDLVKEKTFNRWSKYKELMLILTLALSVHTNVPPIHFPSGGFLFETILLRLFFFFFS